MERENFLYEEFDILRKYRQISEISNFIKQGLSKRIELREYQKEAFENFITYFENEKLNKNKQIHTLFHMATGSGKTVIMAGLILYLYEKGYRNFLFFVKHFFQISKNKIPFGILVDCKRKLRYYNEIDVKNISTNWVALSLLNASSVFFPINRKSDVCIFSRFAVHFDKI